VKLIGRWSETTVNDVLLATVSGALRSYLLEQGRPTTDMTAMVPFNLRALQEPISRELGNHFGLVLAELPLATEGPSERLRAVHSRMDQLKRSPDASLSYGLLTVAGSLSERAERRIVDLFSSKASAVMTNVPGPRETVRFAGVPVSTALVWAPTSGHIGISVSVFSYDDHVTVGLMVDPIHVPDPERIAALIELELETLANVYAARFADGGTPR